MDSTDNNLDCPHEECIDVRPQTSSNLDLNVEQNCRSPTVAHGSAGQSSNSSKEEPDMSGALKIGMEFESDEHAYIYYNKYAGLVGFSIRKDWINRSKIHGQVVSRKFTCSKEGYRRKDKRDANVKKQRKETRTGCLAHMVITRQPDGKYRVTHFEANHNHEYVNSSNARKLHEFSSPGVVDVTEVIEVDSGKNPETRSKLAFQMLGRRFGAGENFDFLERNYKNHLRSARTRDMKEGEAARLLYYFQRQHFENPSFFYAIQFDVDDKVSNIFWADDNMVVDYDHFGEVVCFDTTYRAREDFRPLVQFIGLNHHKQLVIFAAALLYDETVDSLKWLFRTFTEVMSGKKPKTILTNQDSTIVEAIDSVFPESNHCVCVWQMYQNALKNLCHVTEDAESFAKDFRRCIFDHEDEEDFVHAWDAMIDKFSLRQNEWLRWMFREKEKWAVVYGRNTFFMDMKRAHLCENLSSNLRNSLKSDLDVLEFFKHFETLVNEQRYKELEANYDMGRCTVRLMGNVVLLKHTSDIYTPKAFEVFQREYEKCLNVVVNHIGQNGSLLEYKANTFERSREYIVTFNSLDDTVSCSCMKFEHVGFLCCHALKVLDHRNIKVVPTHYILKRWTKDARVETGSENSAFSEEENPKLVIASRYKDLCHRMLKISARASESDQAFEFAARQLDEVMQGVENILRPKPSKEARAITSSSTDANASESDQAEIFLDRNAIEGHDNSNLTDRDSFDNLNANISSTKRSHNVQPSPPDTITVSCPQTAYISSPSSTLNPVTQGLYNFEANQVVHCIYPSTIVGMDQQPNPDLFQPPNLYINQHDSPSHAQESLTHGSFQSSMSNDNQLRQGMELDVQHPHSSSCFHYDSRYSTSNTQYYGSR